MKLRASVTGAFSDRVDCLRNKAGQSIGCGKNLCIMGTSESLSLHSIVAPLLTAAATRHCVCEKQGNDGLNRVNFVVCSPCERNQDAMPNPPTPT